MAVRAPRQHHPAVRVDQDGDVTTVTLDAPERKNACTGDMWVALGATFQQLSSSGTRVVVLTGASENFCAGADLTPDPRPRDDDAPPDSMLASMRVLADAVLAIHGCSVPVVAKVDGVCVGAGLGLALAADMTWCSDRARLCAIFARRGLSLDFGTSWFLRQRIGVHRAKELALTARMLSGTEAAAMGLVNASVPHDDLDDAVDEVVATIAAGPPIALSMSKRQLDAGANASLADSLEAEALAQSVNVHTQDLREALTAFAERRDPRFEGR